MARPPESGSFGQRLGLRLVQFGEQLFQREPNNRH